MYMPNRLARYCAEPGCPSKVSSGRCAAHQKGQRQVERRRYTGTYGVNYGRRWRAFRATFLADHPFCVDCERLGRLVVATDVDHINGHDGTYEGFYAGPFQALCHEHHSAKTWRELHGGVSGC